MNIVREILSPLIAVIAAFIVGGLIIAFLGDNSIEAYVLLLSNSSGSTMDLELTFSIMLDFIALALVVQFTLYFYEVPGDALMQPALSGAAGEVPILNLYLPFRPAGVRSYVAFALASGICCAVYSSPWNTKR